MKILNLIARLLRPQCVPLLLAIACHAATASVPRGKVDVTDASVRIPKAGFSATVAMMTLRVDRDVEIVGASTPVAARADLQTMTRNGIEVRMQTVTSVPLPAGETRLRTGEGQHFVMLHGIRRALAPGATVPITLRVRSEGRTSLVSVRAKVVAPRSYSPVPEEDLH